MTVTGFGIKILITWFVSFSDSLLGHVFVPFDLVKKQPKGHQTFTLMTKDKVTGSLTTDVRPLTQVKTKTASQLPVILQFHSSVVFIYTILIWCSSLS